MDPNTNAPAEAEVNTLGMISDLRTAEPSAESPAEPPQPSPAPAEPPAEEQPAEVSDQEAEERRNQLLREIASDPLLTQQYAQGQFYPQQEEEVQPFQLPFDEDSFDPTNPAHQQALFDARLMEIGGPLFEKINQIAQRFEQQEQLAQQQAFQQQAQQANQKTVALLDTYVPGFSGIAEKDVDSWSPVEEAVFTLAANMENNLVQQYAGAIVQNNPGVSFDQAYSFALNNTQIRAQIAQQIGPDLKKKAAALGLVSQPRTAQLTAEQKQVMKQESYVESSNAVPAVTAGSFDKALESGDSFQMIRALRQR